MLLGFIPCKIFCSMLEYVYVKESRGFILMFESLSDQKVEYEILIWSNRIDKKTLTLLNLLCADVREWKWSSGKTNVEK